MFNNTWRMRMSSKTWRTNSVVFWWRDFRIWRTETYIPSCFSLSIPTSTTLHCHHTGSVCNIVYNIVTPLDKPRGRVMTSVRDRCGDLPGTGGLWTDWRTMGQCLLVTQPVISPYKSRQCNVLKYYTRSLYDRPPVLSWCHFIFDLSFRQYFLIIFNI